jgi:hypothetical protein
MPCSRRCLLLTLIGYCLRAQAPPPMPQPKPLVVPPIGTLRPKVAAPVTPPPAGTPVVPPPAAAAPASPTTAKPAPQAFGHTPPPWPDGSTAAKDFPSKIPRVPAARLAVYSMSGGTAMAYFTCDAGPRTVADLYRRFAQSDGWELVPFPGPPLEQEAVLIARQEDWTLRVDASVNPLTHQTEAFVLVMLKPLPPEPAAGKAKP